jgi:hypothetical protein
MLILKYIYIACFAYVFLSAKNPSYYMVTGKITYTSEYCGGAAPSEDLLKLLETPKPFAYKRMYYRPGKYNHAKVKAASIVTDSLGFFKVKLSANDYVFFDENKLKVLVIPQNTIYEIYDTACLKATYIAGDFKVNKKQKNKKVLYNYHIYCTYHKPCVSYSGPLPPMAAPR